MLKHAVADVTDLQSEKAPLEWEAYLELLLSSCSDYDKSHNNARLAQRNIYATNDAYDIAYDYQHEDTPHGVVTDIMENYANATQTTNPGNTSPFIPREQWIQLIQE
jgi:hypothetical protein